MCVCVCVCVCVCLNAVWILCAVCTVCLCEVSKIRSVCSWRVVCVCVRCVHCAVCDSVVSGVFPCEERALWSVYVVRSVCLCEMFPLFSVCFW